MKFIEDIIIKTNIRERVLLTAVFFSLIFSFFYMFYIPRSNQVAESKQALDVLNEEITGIGIQVESIKSNINVVEPKISQNVNSGELLNYVLRRGRLSNLLDELTKISKENNVEFLGLLPKEAVKKDQYIELTIKMEVKSGFNNLVNFLKRLESTKMPISIIDIQIATGSKGSVATNIYAKTLLKG